TTLKSRDVGQGLPSLAMPRAGGASFLAWIASLAASKNAVALQNAFWPKIVPSTPFTQEAAPGPRSLRLVALKPTQSPTTAPRGRSGRVGSTAGREPRSITSGSYTETWPVAGSMTAPSTKADWAELASWQGPAPSPVSCHGVASPRALSG